MIRDDIELGDIGEATNCIVYVKAGGRERRSDQTTNGCVRVLRNGDNMGNVPRYTQEDAYYYLREYVDGSLGVNIGTNEVHRMGYLSGDGYLDAVLRNGSDLLSGSGTILNLSFFVKSDAEIGTMSGLTISESGLANQYGGDLSWGSGVVSSNGTLGVMLSDIIDSDGDGLSDRAEQLLDGMVSYSPWDGSDNPLGGDTDADNPDTDNDGMKDGAEKVAGTSALKPSELLKILSAAKETAGTNGFRLSWPTVMGKKYAVEGSTNLVGVFTPMITNVSGSGSSESYIDTNAVNNGTKYYRIKVR